MSLCTTILYVVYEAMVSETLRILYDNFIKTGKKVTRLAAFFQEHFKMSRNVFEHFKIFI